MEKTTDSVEQDSISDHHHHHHQSNNNNKLLNEDIDLFLNSLSATNNNLYPVELSLPDCVHTFLTFVDSLIENYELGVSSNIFIIQQDNEEDENEDEDKDADAAYFLQSIHLTSKLSKALYNFSSSSSFNQSTTLLHRAMSIFEDEFRTLLEASSSSSSKPPPSLAYQKSIKTKLSSSFKSDKDDQCVSPTMPTPGTDGDQHFPTYSPESVSNMNRIATSMISAGYQSECLHVYTILRRNAFKDELKRLGFETISIDDVHKMQWEQLEGVIATWIKVVKHCSAVLFPGELNFCTQVFSDYPAISRSLFKDLARVVITHLLNFAESVAMTKRATEKLFKFLDMHEALVVHLIPAIDDDDNSGTILEEELHSETSITAGRLGEAAVSIFCELENSIKNDHARQPVPSGAVHPLTRFTMNYLKYACDDYRKTLEHIFQQHHHGQHKHNMNEQPSESAQLESEDSLPNNQNSDQLIKHTPFAEQVIAVMDLLDINLDSKSKLYKDPSLRYIFLMNNGRYISQKIKASTEIHDMVGNVWYRKRSSDLRQYHKNYQRETWGRLLGCLGNEGLHVNGKLYKPALKDKFKSFNTLFDEIHKVQSTWVVSDEKLQSELRVSISALVIPAYRSFLGRFSQHLDGGRHSEKYIKYQADDIETMIDQLFEGTPVC